MRPNSKDTIVTPIMLHTGSLTFGGSITVKKIKNF